MAWLFHELLYRPLFNLMIFFYNQIPGADIGIAVILTTIVVRILMLPLYRQSLKSQREVAVLQPKVKELQEKYKDDKQKLSEELLKVYQEHKINPFAGILLLFAQLPILIAIYRVSMNIFRPETYPELYGFISLPETINTISLGFLPIEESASTMLRTQGIWEALPVIFVVLMVGVLQFLQIQLIMKRNMPSTSKKKSASTEPDMTEIMNKQMSIVMPGLVTILSFGLPMAMSLYWITTTIATIVQEFFLIRSMNRSSN